MVPIKEMTDVLKVVKETAQLKPRQWVRLKRGIFKDDLAQVIISKSYNFNVLKKTFSFHHYIYEYMCLGEQNESSERNRK